jgi:MFS family permease
MLHSVYITLESGACIYARHYIDSRIDNQLLSGFIHALGSFANEALGSEMQSLRLQTGEQLSIMRYPYGKFPIIGILIADARDNTTLIRNLLLQVLTEFYTIFQKQLEQDNASNITEFEEFSYTLESILEGKVASRSNLKMLIGIIVGLVIVGIIVSSLIPLYIEVANFDMTQLGLPNIIFSDDLDPAEFQALQSIVLVLVVAIMGFSCVVFFLPTFIAAYIAGNKKRGIWTAILFGISIGAIILIASPFIESFTDVNAFLWYLAFSPLLLFLALVCGFYGGRLKERRKLYPLEEDEDLY